jgi:hypothetical protein
MSLAPMRAYTGRHMARRLLAFAGHLPRLATDELEGMAELNPRSPVEVREEIKEFLKGANQCTAN